MRRSAKRFAAAGVLVMALLPGGAMRGDDLVTLSGTTYHDVRPVRVEPDGVTWEYDEGVCKVDFTDSPEGVRRAYHYDVTKATAYHDARVQQQQQAEAQRQQVLQENDARRQVRVQAAAARVQASTSAGGTELTFRRAASPAASEATRALGEQLEAAAAKKAVEPTGVYGGIAHTWMGSTLAKLGLINFYQGPSRLNATDAEVGKGATKGGLQQESSASSPSYYTRDVPEYSTKSYYDDVDRSEAFLRGVPLRP